MILKMGELNTALMNNFMIFSSHFYSPLEYYPGHKSTFLTEWGISFFSTWFYNKRQFPINFSFPPSFPHHIDVHRTSLLISNIVNKSCMLALYSMIVFVCNISGQNNSKSNTDNWILKKSFKKIMKMHSITYQSKDLIREIW